MRDRKPVRKILEVLNNAEIPALISNSLGTHNCRLTMHSTLHSIEQNTRSKGTFHSRAGQFYAAVCSVPGRDDRIAYMKQFLVS